MPLKLTDQCELQSIENTVRISDGPSFCVDVLYDRQHYIDKRVSVVLVVGVGIHTDSAFMAHYLGPDRLELIIFDITNKKICNHPCRL